MDRIDLLSLRCLPRDITGKYAFDMHRAGLERQARQRTEVAEQLRQMRDRGNR